MALSTSTQDAINAAFGAESMRSPSAGLSVQTKQDISNAFESTTPTGKLKKIANAIVDSLDLADAKTSAGISQALNLVDAIPDSLNRKLQQNAEKEQQEYDKKGYGNIAQGFEKASEITGDSALAAASASALGWEELGSLGGKLTKSGIGKISTRWLPNIAGKTLAYGIKQAPTGAMIGALTYEPNITGKQEVGHGIETNIAVPAVFKYGGKKIGDLAFKGAKASAVRALQTLKKLKNSAISGWGEILESDQLKKFESEYLPNIFGAGMGEHLAKMGNSLTAATKKTYNIITQELPTATKLIKPMYAMAKSGYKQRENQATRLYDTVDRLGAEKVQVSKEPLRQSINKILDEYKGHVNEQKLLSMPEFETILKKVSEPPTKTTNISNIVDEYGNNINLGTTVGKDSMSYKTAKLLKSRLNEMANDIGLDPTKGGKYASGVLKSVSSQLDKMIKDALSISPKNVQDAAEIADDYFANEVAPFRTPELRPFTTGKKSPYKAFVSILKTGKGEDPENIEKIARLVGSDGLPYLKAYLFKDSVYTDKVKPSIKFIDPLKFSKAYDNQTDETKDLLYTPEERAALNKQTLGIRYAQNALKQVLNPATGAAVVPVATQVETAKNILDAVLGKSLAVVNTIGGGKLATMLLTNPKILEIVAKEKLTQGKGSEQIGKYVSPVVNNYLAKLKSNK